jgi:hypothetical protein
MNELKLIAIAAILTGVSLAIFISCIILSNFINQ